MPQAADGDAVAARGGLVPLELAEPGGIEPAVVDREPVEEDAVEFVLVGEDLEQHPVAPLAQGGTGNRLVDELLADRALELFEVRRVREGAVEGELVPERRADDLFWHELFSSLFHQNR